MKPLTFHVEAAGEFRPVELKFATEAHVRSVRSWQKLKPADAGEFAALAAKRWFYYAREDSAFAHTLDSALMERGIRVLIDRSAGKADIGVPFVSLASYFVPDYAPEDVPPEMAAIPAIKPGSRGL